MANNNFRDRFKHVRHVRPNKNSKRGRTRRRI